MHRNARKHVHCVFPYYFPVQLLIFHHTERCKGRTDMRHIDVYNGYSIIVVSVIFVSTEIQQYSIIIAITLTYSHYNDVIMGTMASHITSLTIVYSTVYSGADQRQHQSSASLAFVRGIHRWQVNSPHNGPASQKRIHLITSSWQNSVLLRPSDSCISLGGIRKAIPMLWGDISSFSRWVFVDRSPCC